MLYYLFLEIHYLDQEFRNEVKKHGKQFNLSLEEAMKLWIKNSTKENVK